MFNIAVGLALSGAFGGGIYFSVHRLAWVKQRDTNAHKPRTIIDVYTCEEAEHLVRTVDRGDGGDTIASSLYSIYATFPPTERTMQSLATMYESVKNKGGVEEYVVTLLYGVTTDVLRDPSVQQRAKW